MSGHKLSIRPLLALLLSAAALGFGACGTPDIGFVPDGDVDSPGAGDLQSTKGFETQQVRAYCAQRGLHLEIETGGVR